jgi:hypothetical protein
MSTHPIPAASLDRIRAAYASFEQITQVVAEAMGIDMNVRHRLDLPSGSFITDENESPNGVAEEVTHAVPS